MRAAVFVRYHSGDELGHVAWAFDAVPEKQVNSGSVENHSGHLFSASRADGFWSQFTSDPMPILRSRRYDDVKYVEVENPDPVAAYRVVLWIREQAYRAAFRNCEDDAYDVLRAYGVQDLPPPSLHWLPKRWFRLFRGTKVPVATFHWSGAGARARDAQPIDFDLLEPLRPTWRYPLHADFHRLRVSALLTASGFRFPFIGSPKEEPRS